MADEIQAAPEGTPVFQIQRMYLKDLSLEQPNAPHILLEQQQPQVDLEQQVVDQDASRAALVGPGGARPLKVGPNDAEAKPSATNAQASAVVAMKYKRESLSIGVFLSFTMSNT